VAESTDDLATSRAVLEQALAQDGVSERDAVRVAARLYHVMVASKDSAAATGILDRYLKTELDKDQAGLTAAERNLREEIDREMNPGSSDPSE
jgi:hypothetical protein